MPIRDDVIHIRSTMEIIIIFLGFYSNLRSSNQKIQVNPNGQKNGKSNNMHGLFEKNTAILQYFRCIKKYCNTFVWEQNQ